MGWIAAALFTVPIFFAGLLFAREFRSTVAVGPALAANMLGAVVGGLMENLSLVIGLNALLLVAAAIYMMAGVGLRRAPALKSAALGRQFERQEATSKITTLVL